jgi:mono/diheme cytochrome c family protein
MAWLYDSVMKTLRPLLVILVASLAVCAASQATKVNTTGHVTTAIGGKALFGQYCAVCHGVDGKGAGPAAKAMVQHPTDVTQIKRENKGTFPEERFLKMMNGELSLPSHGSAGMPIWGEDFRNTTNNPNTVQDRIHALMNYIEEIQAK